MPDALSVVAKWIQKWQAIVAVGIGLIGIGVAWQVVRGDTEAMRNRIESVEKKIESFNDDHDLLIRIDANVQAMSERLKRIEAKP